MTAFYALEKLGAIVAWVNPMYRETETKFILNNSEARGILFSGNGKIATISKMFQTLGTVFPEKGLSETRGNKTESARILGLPSYQTLTNWLKKYGLE